MIYYFDDLNRINELKERELDRYISDERAIYASRFKFRNGRIQIKIAYLLLRAALYLEYGIKEPPQILMNPNGKPYLVTDRNLYFNFSHCKEGVVCGLSRQEIGVDIQEYIDFDVGTARMFMTNDELKKIGELTMLDELRNFRQIETDHFPGVTEVQKEFTKIWALKESYGKYSSQGICYDMTRFQIEDGVRKENLISKSFSYKKYVLAVTTQENIKLVPITIHELMHLCEGLREFY